AGGGGRRIGGAKMGDGRVVSRKGGVGRNRFDERTVREPLELVARDVRAARSNQLMTAAKLAADVERLTDTVGEPRSGMDDHVVRRSTALKRLLQRGVELPVSAGLGPRGRRNGQNEGGRGEGGWESSRWRPRPCGLEVAHR